MGNSILCNPKKFTIVPQTNIFCSLNYLFPTFVKNNIFYQLHDGKEHGIDIEKLPQDISLVIAPDASSNEEDIHDLLHLCEQIAMPTSGLILIVKLLAASVEIMWNSKNDMLHFLSGILFPEQYSSLKSSFTCTAWFAEGENAHTCFAN